MTIIDTISECSICFNTIDPKKSVLEPLFSEGVVCEKCNKLFNDSEKEILIHCFNVARGMFYESSSERLKIKDLLFDVLQEIILERKPEISLQNIFIKILLRAKDYGLKLNFNISTCFQEDFSLVDLEKGIEIS